MAIYEFNYEKALYRRNNFGEPCVWACRLEIPNLYLYHGIIGKTITKTHVKGTYGIDEMTRYINAKRKTGYKYLSELKDNVTLPVEGELLSYLNSYLPTIRTNEDGKVLAMLAKTYDNENNKLFKKVSSYFGQYKINGLRCFISAHNNNGDLFKPIRLEFQSREGEIWKSLNNLEEYLLNVIPDKFINRMINEHIILDGEVYLPGHTVNQINHYVKDPNCDENKLLQFWCYDLAIEDYTQDARLKILHNELNNYITSFNCREDHLNNKNRLIVLDSYDVYNDTGAYLCRNNFIDLGFEGLILRDPYKEYQFGTRNSAMIKYKSFTDGKFKIIDIYPEGTKRGNIPLFLCKNDINDETFEVHIGGDIDYQEEKLINKDKYIGKELLIEFGERSGVKQVPFHVKGVRL